jgi:hypothetical protein
MREHPDRRDGYVARASRRAASTVMSMSWKAQARAWRNRKSNVDTLENNLQALRRAGRGPTLLIGAAMGASKNTNVDAACLEAFATRIEITDNIHCE